MRAIEEKPKTLTNSLIKIKYETDRFADTCDSYFFPPLIPSVENNESALIEPVKK